MKALLLAAGFATRLHPLTLDCPKPLLEVGGQPVLDSLLDRIWPLPGLTGVVLVTNERFHDHFARWAAARAFPVPVQLVNDGARTNEERRGGVRDLALGFAAADPDEDVLVAGGDNLLGFPLEPLHAEFRRRGCPVLLARKIPGRVPPGRHGEVRIDAAGRITAFREKPRDPATHLVATCIYAFPPAVRKLLDAYLAEGGEPDAPGHFLGWLCARTPVHAVVAEGPYFDIGSPETLEAARRAFGARA